MTEHFYSSLINYAKLVDEILDAIQEGFWVINYSGEIIKANKTFQQIVGASEEQILGADYKTILPNLPATISDTLQNSIIHKKSKRVIFSGKRKINGSNFLFILLKSAWLVFFLTLRNKNYKKRKSGGRSTS